MWPPILPKCVLKDAEEQSVWNRLTRGLAVVLMVRSTEGVVHKVKLKDSVAKLLRPCSKRVKKDFYFHLSKFG